MVFPGNMKGHIMDENTKQCPFCGEMIKAGASKCRYCREWLNEEKPQTSATAAKVEEINITDTPDSSRHESPEAEKSNTCSGDTVTHLEDSKTNAELKNFWQNRFLPWYQNSYLLFFILIGLLYIGGTKVMDIMSYYAQFGAENIAHRNIVMTALGGIRLVISAVLLAVGMLLIAVRDEEEKLRKTFHNLIFPAIAVVLIPIVYKCIFPPDFSEITGYINADTEILKTMLIHEAIILFAGTVAQIFLMLLIARGKFGRFFLCVIAVLTIMKLQMEAISKWPDQLLHSLFFPLAIWLIVLILALVFCWKTIFKNFHFCFDWKLPVKFLWYAFCIFSAEYFSQKFSFFCQIWGSTWNKTFIFPFVFCGVWFIFCMWSCSKNAEKSRAVFLLKTICFAAISLILMVLMTGLMGYPQDSWWATKEFIICASMISLMFTIKAITNALYCNIKWHFMLPLNMFLFLLGCVPVLQWILPGDNPAALALLEKMNIPVRYGEFFLYASFVIDIFAVICGFVFRKKSFELNRKVYIACCIPVVLLAFYGFFYINEAQAADPEEDVLVLSKNGKTVVGVTIMNTNITAITFPAGVTEIGDAAFTACDKLTDITIPDSITTIGRGAFAFCKNLTDITIPGSITTVREDTFAFCDKLSEVTILDGVTTIEGRAFVACNNLSKITIPDSVTFINGSAFDFCDKLKTLEIPQNCTCERGYFFLGKVIRRAK